MTVKNNNIIIEKKDNNENISLSKFTLSLKPKFSFLDETVEETVLDCLKKGKSITASIDEICEAHEDIKPYYNT